MLIFLWTLYALDIALHLYACVPQTKFRLRAITKCLLMPLLALCYALTVESFSIYIFMALLFGFLGDTFLILPQRKWTFACGLGSFLVGHVFYIIYMLGALPALPPVWLAVLLGAICVVVSAAFLYYLRKYIPKALITPCLFYMLTITAMASSAFLFMRSSGSFVGALAFIGALFFIVSDGILSIATFKRALHYRHLLVMSTYIVAQTLIVVSLMFA